MARATTRPAASSIQSTAADLLFDLTSKSLQYGPMLVMRLAEVPTTERDRVFRYSRARALALVCALIVIGGGAVRLGLRGPIVFFF